MNSFQLRKQRNEHGGPTRENGIIKITPLRVNHLLQVMGPPLAHQVQKERKENHSSLLFQIE